MVKLNLRLAGETAPWIKYLLRNHKARSLVSQNSLPSQANVAGTVGDL